MGMQWEQRINPTWWRATTYICATYGGHRLIAANEMVLDFIPRRQFRPKKLRVRLVIPFEPFTGAIARRLRSRFDVIIKMVRAEEFFKDGLVRATAKRA